jgi:hypothetical protein
MEQALRVVRINPHLRRQARSTAHRQADQNQKISKEMFFISRKIFSYARTIIIRQEYSLSLSLSLSLSNKIVLNSKLSGSFRAEKTEVSQ